MSARTGVVFWRRSGEPQLLMGEYGAALISAACAVLHTTANERFAALPTNNKMRRCSQRPTEAARRRYDAFTNEFLPIGLSLAPLRNCQPNRDRCNASPVRPAKALGIKYWQQRSPHSTELAPKVRFNQ